MIRMPVSSRNVVSVGYDQNTMTLEVEFKDGALYQYFDVPVTVYEEFVRASSVGGFLHAHIRDNYRYVRL